MAAPSLQIEYWPTDRLLPYAANARTHPEAQVSQIAASIREFGFNVPCLVNDAGELAAGHGRVLAAKRLGLVDVPVIRLSHLTEAQLRAFRLADNRIALNSDWDLAILSGELARIVKEDALDPALLGFGDDEIAALLKAPTAGDGDAGAAAAAAEVKLADRFGAVPFSVFNAREGWWQDRKRAWIALGIQSELGRGENLIGRSLHDRLSMILGVHYRDVVRFIEEHRARGLDDAAIEAEAQRVAGAPAGHDALAVARGVGWTGGVARHDPAFYEEKRAWERANGRTIDTTEFRLHHYSHRPRGAANGA